MIENQEMHRIATTAIIFRSDGRMLITQRSPNKKRFPGLWTVPGGGLETADYTSLKPTYDGEILQWDGVVERSIRREVMEEVGLEITKPWFVIDLTLLGPDEVSVLVLSYAAHVANVKYEVKLDEDSVDHAWVNLRQARSYPLIDGIYDEMKMAERMRMERGML